MSKNCPTCGQPMPVRGSDDAVALLRLLQHASPRREVYRADRTGEWFVTYGGGQWTDKAVNTLVQAGCVSPVYSNCPDAAYHIGATLDADQTWRLRREGSKTLVYLPNSRPRNKELP